nr:MAG TPA: RimK-related lysine biosynthesis protein, Probable-dependent amine/thiol ligase family Amino-group [Caudoviricetes sp.]
MDEVRLIDAKKLETEILNWQNSTTSKAQYDAYENALNEVFDSPTVDPESLRPVSRWDSSGKYTFMDKKNSIAVCCENCGCALHMREYKESVWKFCPVCGARMEGE